MVAKYKKEHIMALNELHDDNHKDLNNILFTQEGVPNFYIQYLTSFTQDDLVVFGTSLLNRLKQSSYNFYLLTLPSTFVVGGLHTVALVTVNDGNKKKIYYHDSHGTDMYKILEDFFKKLLPEYDIEINYSKQQADVVDVYDQNKNDNSCALLAKYNLRDIWYKINGQTDKVCNFNSVQARTDAWDKLKGIQKEEVPEVQVVEPTAQRFKAAKISIRKKTPEKHLAVIDINEPNYEEILDETVQIAKSNHVAYCNQMSGDRDK